MFEPSKVHRAEGVVIQQHPQHHHPQRPRPHAPDPEEERAEQHVPFHRRTKLSQHSRTGTSYKFRKDFYRCPEIKRVWSNFIEIVSP